MQQERKVTTNSAQIGVLAFVGRELDSRSLGGAARCRISP